MGCCAGVSKPKSKISETISLPIKEIEEKVPTEEPRKINKNYWQETYLIDEDFVYKETPVVQNFLYQFEPDSDFW